MSEVLSDLDIETVNLVFHKHPDIYYYKASAPFHQHDPGTIEQHLTGQVGRTLARKIVTSEIFELLGIRGFCSDFYQLLVELPEGTQPVVEAVRNNGTRQYITRVRLGDRALIIKPYQGPEEKLVAEVADKLSFGPHTITGLGELVEKDLGELRLPNAKPREIGRQAGALLRLIHTAGVIYNDSFAKHVRYCAKQHALKLIDFGVSFFYDTRELGEGPAKTQEVLRLKTNELLAMKRELLIAIETGAGFKHLTRRPYATALEEGIEEGYRQTTPTFDQDSKNYAAVLPARSRRRTRFSKRRNVLR